MKATETTFERLMDGKRQFIIPIFQRTYSWELKQCRQLWRDVVDVGRDEGNPGHFIGSVVYIERHLYQATVIPELLVIDGQQRLTTLSLLVSALIRSLPEDGHSLNRDELASYFLLNDHQRDHRRYKLLLTQGDRETLIALIEDKPLPEIPSRRVKENYHFFERQIAESELDPSIIYRGIRKLLLVDISLDREHDNPQLIFESLNSTGLDLSQADLIRNYVLMGQDPGVQEQLYRQHWFPMEQSFGQEEYARHFDRFMRDYLTVKTGRIPNIRQVYSGFKAFAPSTESGPISQVIADVQRNAAWFVRMAFAREDDKELAKYFRRINSLQVDVAYPFLLKLYDDQVSGILSRDDYQSLLNTIESYIFRRSICGVPTNALSKVFAALASEVDPDAYLDSVTAALVLRQLNQRFPRDDEFVEKLSTSDVYNTRTVKYLLSRLENHGSKEWVDTDDYTIEHILPQNDKLPLGWREMLGESWVEVQSRYVHTLGNLSLTGYNSEYSDRPFLLKRDHPRGFARSPLRLNDDLRTADRWDADSIKARAARLAELATAIWPYPQLEEHVVAKYRKTEDAAAERIYTLDDHPALDGDVRARFEQLQERVLDMDASIREEIRMHYIAYKLDGNFLSVEPQKKRLKLYLNASIEELDDPAGLCSDVSSVGHRPSGNVLVVMDDATALHDVVALVEQALLHQMVRP